MLLKPIVDLSEHEGSIDFAILAPHVAGVILRLGYGNQKDARLEEYYAGAKAAKIPLAGYHFPIAERTVNDQVNNLAGWLDGREFILGLGIDVETPMPQHSQTKPFVDAYLSAVKGRLGVKPMIYTSAEMWKRIMGVPYYTEYTLWVAQYGGGGPVLPVGAISWVLWQYTDQGKLPGASAALDLNNYNIPLVETLEPITLTADEIKLPIGKLVTTNTTLKLAVRLYPASGAIVRWLDADTILDYYEKRLNWYRIGFNEWISGAWVKELEIAPPYTEPEIPEPQPEEPQDYLFEAIVDTTYDFVPVREGPGMNFKELERLVNGDKIKVLEANKDRWYRIGEGRWVFGQRCASLQEPLKSLAYPMEKKFRISQIFGVASGTYASSAGHNGVDWACYGGTKLIAAADGFVETREDNTTYGYGRHIRIRVQGGVLIYGHMRTIYSKLGDKVQKGDVIGLSDGEKGLPTAGFSTGAHLHFEYRLDKEPKPLKAGNKTYWAIDPLPLLEAIA